MSPTPSGPWAMRIRHNGIMKKSFLGIILFLAIGSFGCTPKKFLLGGKNPDRPIRTIVSLSPGTTEVICTMQLQDKLVGRTASCDYPLNVTTVPVVMAGTKPDFEKIASIRPDLIVYDEKLYANTDMSKFKALLPQTDVLPMNADTVDKLIDYIYEVGGRTATATFASKTADDIYAAEQNAIAGQSSNKPRVAVFTGGGASFYVAGKTSFIADVIRISGGTPIGPDGDMFSPMPIEALVKENPDIILVSEKGAQILKDPRLASINAVKARPKPRVFEVEPGILLRTGPRVKGLIESLSNSVQQVARGN